MGIRLILVPFSDEKSEIIALEAASQIAQNFNSHILCLNIAHDPNEIFYIKTGFDLNPLNGFKEEIEKANKLREKKALEKFQKTIQKYKITECNLKNHKINKSSASFITHTGYAKTIISEKGRVVDLIVTGSSKKIPINNKENPIFSSIFTTGRPVLFVPDNIKNFSTENIMIAWNGSCESARAISQSLTLLKKAKNVYIVTVKEKFENNAHSAREIALYLRTHEINTNTIIIGKDGSKPSEALLHKSIQLETNLVIMGAITHSRLGKNHIGKVTEHFINNSKIPIFMSN